MIDHLTGLVALAAFAAVLWTWPRLIDASERAQARRRRAPRGSTARRAPIRPAA